MFCLFCCGWHCRVLTRFFLLLWWQRYCAVSRSFHQLLTKMTEKKKSQKIGEHSQRSNLCFKTKASPDSEAGELLIWHLLPVTHLLMPGEGLLECSFGLKSTVSSSFLSHSLSDAQVSAPVHWQEAAVFSVKPWHGAPVRSSAFWLQRL